MTYGQIRMRLSQLHAGISLDLIDGWIRDRYTEILDALKWQRLEVRSVIQTSELVATGTITLTQGSASVAGSSTGWTSAITGCGLYVPGRGEWYEATYVSPTSLTLDRPFEGSDLAGVSYKLFQSVYVLPSDCRQLKSVTSLANGPLRNWEAWMDAAPITFGSPQAWRMTMDDTSDPPLQQIELYPIPDSAEALAVEYTGEKTLTGSTSVTLLPWIREGCLVAGVEADALNFEENYAGADRKEARFQKLLGDMKRTEADRTPPKPIRVSAKYDARSFK